MNASSKLTLRAIQVGSNHSHVNAINTFAKIAASGLHEIDVDKQIDWEITQYENVIKALKDLKEFAGKLK
jgi:hypothetical protein